LKINQHIAKKTSVFYGLLAPEMYGRHMTVRLTLRFDVETPATPQNQAFFPFKAHDSYRYFNNSNYFSGGGKLKKIRMFFQREVLCFHTVKNGVNLLRKSPKTSASQRKDGYSYA